MFETLTLANLPQRALKVIRPPSSTRPVIWLVEEYGAKVVVKDFSRNGFFYRNIFGRFLIWREEKAYRRLKNLEGVPRCYGTIDGLAIITEFIDGKTLKQIEKERRLTPSFFSRFEELVEAFHARGIAHCDLKRTPNILVTRDNRPYILDWAAAVSSNECRIFPLTRLYNRLVRDDEMAIIKIKLRHLPEEVSAEQQLVYERRSKAEQVVRAIRDKLREWLQRVA